MNMHIEQRRRDEQRDTITNIVGWSLGIVMFIIMLVTIGWNIFAIFIICIAAASIGTCVADIIIDAKDAYKRRNN